MKPDVSIIIPSCDSEKMLNITIKSILEATRNLNAEMLIVNDSKANNPNIEVQSPNLRLLNNPKKGLPTARNFGVANTTSEYIFLIDDDFLIEEFTVIELLKLLKIHPDKVFNAAWEYPPVLIQSIKKKQFGRYLIKEGYTSIKDRLRGFQWNDNEMFERIKGVSGGFLAITRSNYVKTGGYLEDMIFAGDTNYAQRIKDSGLKLFIVPNVKAYHNESDKIDLISWLNRRKFGTTQLVKHRMAPRPNYSPLKETLLRFLSNNKAMLFFAERIIPNIKFLDPIYNRAINALFAVYLYEAYTDKENGL